MPKTKSGAMHNTGMIGIFFIHRKALANSIPRRFKVTCVVVVSRSSCHLASLFILNTRVYYHEKQVNQQVYGHYSRGND